MFYKIKRRFTMWNEAMVRKFGKKGSLKVVIPLFLILATGVTYGVYTITRPEPIIPEPPYEYNEPNYKIEDYDINSDTNIGEINIDLAYLATCISLADTDNEAKCTLTFASSTDYGNNASDFYILFEDSQGEFFAHKIDTITYNSTLEQYVVVIPAQIDFEGLHDFSNYIKLYTFAS